MSKDKLNIIAKDEVKAAFQVFLMVSVFGFTVTTIVGLLIRYFIWLIGLRPGGLF